jgi:hypothetical protein
MRNGENLREGILSAPYRESYLAAAQVNRAFRCRVNYWFLEDTQRY